MQQIKTGMAHFPHLYLNKQGNKENDPIQDNPSPEINAANLMVPLVVLPAEFTVSLKGTRILRECEVGKEKQLFFLISRCDSRLSLAGKDSLNTRVTARIQSRCRSSISDYASITWPGS